MTLLRPSVLIDPGNDVNLFFSNQIFEKVLWKNVPGEKLGFCLTCFPLKVNLKFL